MLPFVVDTGGNVRSRSASEPRPEILWELGQYAVMKLGSSGLRLMYEDTIGISRSAVAGRSSVRR
ncbi:MAG: hypothetical protein ACJ74X_10945 [Gaiellaceae bacterium]